MTTHVDNVGLLFFRTWLRAPLRTAALGPSSAGLGRVAAREANIGTRGPVIEFGAGTGALTAALVAEGVSCDRLILFESDPGFQAVLRRRFPGARVIGGDCYGGIDALDAENVAAFVSGLPIVQEPADRRAAFVLSCLDRLGQPEARFVQLTYLPFSPVPGSLLPGISIRQSATVWANLPPARVFSYWRPAGG